MHHPAAVARLLEPRPGWRTEKRFTDHDGDDMVSACLALGGCGELPTAAFRHVYLDDPHARHLLEHELLERAARLQLAAEVDAYE